MKKYLDKDIHIPIQSWLDPIERDDWQGLLATLCLLGDRDIVVEFSGRKMDYEDVQISLDAQNKNGNLGVNLTYKLVEEIPSDFEMKQNIDKAVKLMLTDEFADIVNASESDELIKKYVRLKETYDEIDMREFRIIFTGTYSSGKSSTINALIGKNLLPTATGTCTARICRIVHDSHLNSLATVKYNGSPKKYYCNTSEEVQDKIRNVEESVGEIEVYTDLSSLYPHGVSSDFKIVIIDTPGTDSAIGNNTEKLEDEARRLSAKSHLEITKEILSSKQKEMIVLISGEKFEGENIVDLMNIIEASAEDDDRAFNDRFLFVMNICDQLSYVNPGETLENYVKKFIANIKKDPNSGRIRNIVNPRVFPITSGAALAIVNGYVTKPSIDERNTKKWELYCYYKNFFEQIYGYSLSDIGDNFNQYIEEIKKKHINYHNFCLEEHCDVSKITKYKYKQELEKELSIPERVLIHSGVPALKDAIRDYIRSYAYPIKVRRLLNCFTDILVELKNWNDAKIEECENAKRNYDNADLLEKSKEKIKEQEEEKKRRLQHEKEEMKKVKRKIDGIKDTIPDIDGLRSEATTLKQNITCKDEWVKKSEGERIIRDIIANVDDLVEKIEETVRKVKKKKKEEVETLYNDFLECIDKLADAGFMQIGKFSLRDTVHYQKLIDKENFTKPIEEIRDEANPKKERIQFSYGIAGFLKSLVRVWKARKEPKIIQNSYINIEKYISENVAPIEAEIAKFVEELKKDYRSDIDYLKEETKKRIDSVIELIKEKEEEINKIRNEAYGCAADKKMYNLHIKKLKSEGRYLEEVISQLRSQIELGGI